MTESVYKNNTQEEEKKEDYRSKLFKMPKNVRQIGAEEGKQKIYLEDYVMTFIRSMTHKNSMEFQFAVLMGEIIQIDKKTCIFINGAIELEDVELIEETRFTNETWTSIYENVKKYFSEREIVGWFITRPGLPVILDDRFRKLHLDNFSGEHKVLLLYDGLEAEESFYISENGELKKTGGYFIYYEKNEEMQTYMIEKKQNKGIETGGQDENMDKMRKMVSERKINRKKEFSRGLLYSVGTVAAVMVLIIGVTALNRYNGTGFSRKTGNQILDPQTESSTLAVQEGEEEAETVFSTEQERIEEQNDNSEEQEIEKEEQDLLEEKTGSGKTDKMDETDKDILNPDSKNTEGEKAGSGQQEAGETMSENQYYTVKKGDTLASISYKMYQSMGKVEVIKEANQIEDADMILVGQVLLIP